MAGPASSMRTCSTKPSRSEGTPRVTEPGSIRMPFLVCASGSPATDSGPDQWPVNAAYRQWTSATVSAREAASASRSSVPARADSIANPRTETAPERDRSIECGVSARWCRPRPAALPRPTAASPTIRRASSAGSGPSWANAASESVRCSASLTMNARSSWEPTSSTRTRCGSSTAEARRALSTAAAAPGRSSSKSVIVTSRSRVASWASQSSWSSARRRRVVVV